MSFGASAKQARDPAQPIGLRVTRLHDCLEQFNVFGFHATRVRLRAMVGVGEAGWTEGQVVAAVDVLEVARRSWIPFLRDREVRQRAARRTGKPPLDVRAVRIEWREGYLQGATAEKWLVAGLGDCPACGHGLIHHGPRYGCEVCSVTAHWEVPYSPEWTDAQERRCLALMPPPERGGGAATP